jgi:hypothetical protein
MTPEAIHQAGLEMGIESGRIQDKGTLATVQMAMHAAAPKLEAYFNFYDANHGKSHGKRCGSWVDWYGEVVCDVETLAHLVGVEAIEGGSQEMYVTSRCTTYNMLKLILLGLSREPSRGPRHFHSTTYTPRRARSWNALRTQLFFTRH